jgi:hypothetical protein
VEVFGVGAEIEQSGDDFAFGRVVCHVFQRLDAVGCSPDDTTASAQGGRVISDMKKLAHIIQCSLICVAVSSCTPMATLRLVGTKEIDSSLETGPLARGEGEDCGDSILFIPLRVPTLDKAIENALQKENGDFLKNVTASADFWGIPFLYFHLCYYARGTVVKAKPKMDRTSSYENNDSKR